MILHLIYIYFSLFFLSKILFLLFIQKFNLVIQLIYNVKKHFILMNKI